jgi:putative peptidoglycan lipid II flippase
MPSSFIKYTFIFAVATFISRIFGFVRDAVIAFVFGANSLTDAFFVAWRLPNTLRQIFAEGGFNAVFIPTYTSLKNKSQVEAQNYIYSMFSYYTLVLSFITVIAVIFSKWIVLIIAPGFAKNSEVLEVASNCVKIVFPYLILVGWVSFFMALLNTKGRFFLPAVSPALLNLSFIFFSFVFSKYLGIYSLALGALFGGVLQVVLTYYQVKKEGFIIKLTLKLHSKVKETFKSLIPSLMSFGIDQISYILNTILASLIGAGIISYLYFAQRIFQLPVGIIGNGLGNSLIPVLSKYYSSNDLKNFILDVERGIRFSIIASIPSAVGMVLIGKEIIEVLFGRGAFGEKDIFYTYLALLGYCGGLIFSLAGKPLKSGYFALGDYKTPVLSGFVGVVVGFLSAVVFVFFFGMGVFGIAFGLTVSSFVSFVLMWRFFRFSIPKKSILITGFKAGFSSFIFGILLIILKPLITNKLLLVFVCILLSVFVYIIMLKILKEELVNSIINKALKRKT